MPQALPVPLHARLTRERVWWRFYLPNHIVASQRCEDTREISEDDQNTKDYDPDKVILDSSAVV